jgi:hypothetical protein
MMLHSPSNTQASDTRVHDVLRDQLVMLLPPAARIIAHGWRPWASASFAGARHWFDIDGDPATFALCMAIAIDSHEWAVTGAFVADARIAALTAATHQCRAEMLAVDD